MQDYFAALRCDGETLQNFVWHRHREFQTKPRSGYLVKPRF
jgi:hypothetical protein